MHSEEKIYSCRNYIFNQFSIKKEDLFYKLVVNDKKKATVEQINLFTVMLNFGNIPMVSEVLQFSDDQIINFWNYAKDSILKDIDINQYYKCFELPNIYKEDKIPAVFSEGAFYGNAGFKFDINWIPLSSTRYCSKLEGLKIFLMIEGDWVCKGSINPIYYQLYRLIDEANSTWNQKTVNEKNKFIIELNSFVNKAKKSEAYIDIRSDFFHLE